MANLCGKNLSIEGMEELQASMQDIATLGKDALGDIEGLLGDVAAEADAALGKIGGEIPEEAKNLQKELAALSSASSPTEFFNKLAEINDDFGEALEEANIKLEELGLGSFPPTLDATKSFLQKESGIDLDAVASGDLSSIQAKIDEATEAGETPPNIQQIISGDFSSLGLEVPSGEKGICAVIPNLEIPPGETTPVERKADSSIAFKIPVESIKKEIARAKETIAAVRILNDVGKRAYRVVRQAVYEVQINEGATEAAAAAYLKDYMLKFSFTVSYRFAEILGLTFEEYLVSRPPPYTVSIKLDRSRWPEVIDRIENRTDRPNLQAMYEVTYINEYNKYNTTSLTYEEAVIARQASLIPKEEIQADPPAGAKPFTGKYDQETEKLVNYNGKTYVLPKDK